MGELSVGFEFGSSQDRMNIYIVSFQILLKFFSLVIENGKVEDELEEEEKKKKWVIIGPRTFRRKQSTIA